MHSSCACVILYLLQMSLAARIAALNELLKSKAGFVREQLDKGNTPSPPQIAKFLGSVVTELGSHVSVNTAGAALVKCKDILVTHELLLTLSTPPHHYLLCSSPPHLHPTITGRFLVEPICVLGTCCWRCSCRYPAIDRRARLVCANKLASPRLCTAHRSCSA